MRTTEAKCLYADNEDSDQAARMRMLILDSLEGTFQQIRFSRRRCGRLVLVEQRIIQFLTVCFVLFFFIFIFVFASHQFIRFLYLGRLDSHDSLRIYAYSLCLVVVTTLLTKNVRSCEFGCFVIGSWVHPGERMGRDVSCWYQSNRDSRLGCGSYGVHIM